MASPFFVRECTVLLAIVLVAIALILSYFIMVESPHEDSY